ncbi:MAG: hypothetical protein QG599_3382 [Pseudomonadota bacterium]|nr:hypothetical protein [Pseudomonadota bacterium]
MHPVVVIHTMGARLAKKSKVICTVAHLVRTNGIFPLQRSPKNDRTAKMMTTAPTM